MKKTFVTMMMIMVMTTAALSAQSTETKAPTAVEWTTDDVETVWATVSDYQDFLYENMKTMTEEELNNVEEDYLKNLPEFINKKNIKWITKAEVKRCLKNIK